MVSPQSLPRYKEYGVYDAYTGKLVSKHDSRAEADTARTRTGNPHGHRVRGVKPRTAR